MLSVQNFFQKMSGGEALPSSIGLPSALVAGLGAGLAIAVTGFAQHKLDIMLMKAPFGASCFLAFALPSSPLAQPRNIVFGHLISALSGLMFLSFIGDGLISLSLAVACAVIGMLLTRTSHAPAGANPLVVFTVQPSWEFLITPVLLGAVSISFIALIFNNFRHDIYYPKYW